MRDDLECRRIHLQPPRSVRVQVANEHAGLQLITLQSWMRAPAPMGDQPTEYRSDNVCDARAGEV